MCLPKSWCDKDPSAVHKVYDKTLPHFLMLAKCCLADQSEADVDVVTLRHVDFIQLDFIDGREELDPGSFLPVA